QKWRRLALRICDPVGSFKDQRPKQGVMLPHESHSVPFNARMIPTAERGVTNSVGSVLVERFTLFLHHHITSGQRCRLRAAFSAAAPALWCRAARASSRSAA